PALAVELPGVTERRRRLSHRTRTHSAEQDCTAALLVEHHDVRLSRRCCVRTDDLGPCCRLKLPCTAVQLSRLGRATERDKAFASGVVNESRLRRAHVCVLSDRAP